jgi:hypothetical protein
MFQHTDARTAISFAAATAPAVVGWKPGGWIVYDPKDGAPNGVEPELLLAAQGSLPLPLSDVGASVLRSALHAS